MASRHRGGNEVGDGLEARPRWGRRYQRQPRRRSRQGRLREEWGGDLTIFVATGVSDTFRQQ